MKVLVADDNLVSRELLSRHLKSWGYDVIAVGDGIAAKEVLLSADSPRLALVDWMMPKLDGIEVIRDCRAQRGAERHHFILLTGRDSKEDVSVGLQAGADDYVTKPYDTHELKARVAVGVRMVELRLAVLRHQELLDRIRNVAASAGVAELSSILKAA